MPVPGDGELLLVDAAHLQGATFSQVGSHVQVSKLSGEVPGGDPRPGIFDIVVGIDSTEVAQHVSVDKVSVAAAKGEVKVLVRRSP